jgi:hypothetical protein
MNLLISPARLTCVRVRTISVVLTVMVVRMIRFIVLENRLAVDVMRLTNLLVNVVLYRGKIW